MENKKTAQSAGTVVVIGRNLPISTKKAITLCKVLNKRKIDTSIKRMEEIVGMKKGIKLNRKEVLKRGKGTKYPIKVAEQMIKLLKSLSSNATQKGLDTTKIVLSAKADKAPSPMKSGSRLRQFKRTHVIINGKVEESKK